MANQEHLVMLKQGSIAWNEWRQTYRNIRPNLSGADLSNVNFRKVYLSFADLSRATLLGVYLVGVNLGSANLSEANLSGADLRGANLSGADLSRANLTKANLSKTYLNGANLSETNLTGADLTGAKLIQATLVGTNLSHATLTNCSIYGISTWNVQLEETTQFNLKITLPDEPAITVDNLEVAQFIYLLLNNKKIRYVIDTITSKVVLILGRFTAERKAILGALREELRKRGYLPILFDFNKPASRDITETLSTLSHLARFVIADITDSKSIPQELQIIVPHLPSVPVQPLILSSQHEYGMFEHFTRYPWVLPVYRYADETSLLQSLQEYVIAPAEQKAKELAKRY